jgi:hypothetical protein
MFRPGTDGWTGLAASELVGLLPRSSCSEAGRLHPVALMKHKVVSATAHVLVSGRRTMNPLLLVGLVGSARESSRSPTETEAARLNGY